MIIPEKLENKTGVVLFSRSLHEAKYEASQLEMICHEQQLKDQLRLRNCVVFILLNKYIK